MSRLKRSLLARWAVGVCGLALLQPAWGFLPFTGWTYSLPGDPSYGSMPDCTPTLLGSKIV